MFLLYIYAILLAFRTIPHKSSMEVIYGKCKSFAKVIYEKCKNIIKVIYEKCKISLTKDIKSLKI